MASSGMVSTLFHAYPLEWIVPELSEISFSVRGRMQMSCQSWTLQAKNSREELIP